MLTILFPKRCHLCDCELTDEERFICRECLSKLPRTLYHRMHLNPMEEKLAPGPPFLRATGVFCYSPHNSIARIIHDFKYHCYPDLAREMGRIVAGELLTTGFFSSIDLIQYIPMSPWKQARRGYNQARMFALGISDITGIPVADNLRARMFHHTQTRLSESEREKNMKGHFRVIYPEELENRSILLVDDVCTTGATLRNAALPLGTIQGVSLSYLTLAST